MSVRTTPEIVADLRKSPANSWTRSSHVRNEAADRLTELDTPRLAKARAILAEGPTHPQYRQLVDAIDTAVALDPGEGLKAVTSSRPDTIRMTCHMPPVQW